MTFRLLPRPLSTFRDRALVAPKVGLSALAAMLALCAACGHKGTGQVRDLRAVLVAYDDSHPSAALTFPTLTYEALVRFVPPEGKHRPWRLWMLAQAPGTVTVSVYKDTIFTAPGDPVDTFTREIVAQDLSSGTDGRWMEEDLQDLDVIDGPVWVGIRKTGGSPALWTSSVSSGQSYLRDRDTSKGLSILPVKRMPMVRLELAPADQPRGGACADASAPK